MLVMLVMLLLLLPLLLLLLLLLFQPFFYYIATIATNSFSSFSLSCFSFSSSFSFSSDYSCRYQNLSGPGCQKSIKWLRPVAPTTWRPAVEKQFKYLDNGLVLQVNSWRNHTSPMVPPQTDTCTKQSIVPLLLTMKLFHVCRSKVWVDIMFGV